MNRLRRSVTLARFVLTCHLLALLVAIATPVVRPHTLQVVCAGGSIRVIVVDEQGQVEEVGHHSLECPLCSLAAPPSPVVVAGFQPPQPLAHALQPAVAAHLTALVGAPLPARGPPSVLA